MCMHACTQACVHACTRACACAFSYGRAPVCGVLACRSVARMRVARLLCSDHRSATGISPQCRLVCASGAGAWRARRTCASATAAQRGSSSVSGCSGALSMSSSPAPVAMPKTSTMWLEMDSAPTACSVSMTREAHMAMVNVRNMARSGWSCGP